MAKLSEVTVSGDTMSAPGPYGQRTLTLREMPSGGWCVWDGPSNNVAGPVRDRRAAAEAALAVLCYDDPSVPGSMAARTARKSRSDAQSRADNAAWEQALRSGEPEPPELA